MRNLIAILLGLGALLGFGVTSRAANEQEPGVVLRLISSNGNEGGGGGFAARIGRSIAIYSPAGSIPASQLALQYGSPFGGLVGNGNGSGFGSSRPTAPPAERHFTIEFTGNLNLRLRSYVKFYAEGRGHLTLTLNGAKVLDTSGDDLSKVTSDEVRLNKGQNAFVADYEFTGKDDAALRLLWQSKSFAAEPLPTALLTHDALPAAPDFKHFGLLDARPIQALAGQSLIAQFRCLKCHSTRMDIQPIADFVRDAPDLSDVGSRLQLDWLMAWIADPQKLRHGAHMPAMLHAAEAPKVASDIAAYLMSLGKPSAAPKNAGDATSGGRLFANLECVVCHTPPGADEDVSRVAIKLVAAKFQPAALQQYLLDPAKHYVWNPMPRFGLSETEAADLAAYLSTNGEAVPKAVAGDAALGKTQFVSAGCANCHPGAEKPNSKPIDLSKSDGNSGCLADVADLKAPQFTLSVEQRHSIAAAIKGHTNFIQRCDAELAEAAVHELRCTACHSRDANESLLSQSLAEASQALHQQFPNPAPGAGELLAAEQRIPSLTFAGEKLRPEWIERFIGGRLDYRPRYFLRARMPAFAAWAPTLARGFAEQHGVSPSLPEAPKPNAALVEAGRALCGKTANIGFSCNQCHPIANVAPFAPFEAPSINFQYVAERLRPDYYFRWMHDPARMDVATKMPRFADADDKTGLAAFDHDAARQFDAMWQYLLTGRTIQSPQ